MRSVRKMNNVIASNLIWQMPVCPVLVGEFRSFRIVRFRDRAKGCKVLPRAPYSPLLPPRGASFAPGVGDCVFEWWTEKPLGRQRSPRFKE